MPGDAQPLVTPERIADGQARVAKLVAALRTVILGKEQTIDEVVAALLARGHVLLEGLPGLGKTELVKALSRLLSLDFRRIQFTPDLLPANITGSHILQERDGYKALVFHPGPVFTNLLLADEINRASPKTQAALLEAMQERRVTTFGETRALPAPFFVLASQNPIELEGTYPLPEAQLDRFLMKLVVGVPSAEVLADIVGTRRRGQPPAPELRLAAGELDALFAAVDRAVRPRGVARWIGRLVAATHADAAEAPELVRRHVRFGGSPRAAIALAEAARAEALLAGRPTAGFEDVHAVVAPVLRHRLVLGYPARVEGVTTEAVIAALLDAV